MTVWKQSVQAAGVWTCTIFEQRHGVTLSSVLSSMSEAFAKQRRAKTNYPDVLFFIGQSVCKAHHHTHKRRIVQSSVSIWEFTDINEGHSPSRVRGVAAATAHTFFDIRWCVLAVTWTPCANSVIKRDHANNEREREKDPRRHHLVLTSPTIFPLLLFSGLPLVPGPRAWGWWWWITPHPPSIPNYVFPKQLGQHRFGWTKSRMRLSLMTGSNSLVKVFHRFGVRLQPTAHRWKVNREKGRGQTSRRTNSG